MIDLFNSQGWFTECPLENLYVGRNLLYFNYEKEGYCSFFENESLKHLTIGGTVTSIAENSFYNCNGIETITSLSTIPPKLGNNNFTNEQYTSIPLYVPQKSIEAYKTADNWKNFYRIEAVETSGINNTECDREGQLDVIYDLNGCRLSKPQKGINIINGKKVLVK